MPYFADHSGVVRLPIADQCSDAIGVRPAQAAAVHALCAHFFSRVDPALVVMPTGSGKTCVMLLAAFALRPVRVLVLTPSRMVRDQLRDSFEQLALIKKLEAIPLDTPLPKVREVKGRLQTPGAWEELRDCDVVISTVQSASPAIMGIAEPPADLFDLILCDEAHHSAAPSWRSLLDHFSTAKHLLFTATPFRRDMKALKGRIVFEYNLAQARQDGVYGELEYVPVEPESGINPDIALASEAERTMEVDRKAGLQHLLMVRTSQAARAKVLNKLYAEHTNLKLRTILGSHSQKRLTTAVSDMREGKLDGVICVDMLGEGFDLPNLKLAVLHSPHRSLAVTLQFIGRFARTTGANTGNAKFLAVPSEIEIEANKLYVAGAEWNEIVEGASRRRVESEVEARDVIESFHEESIKDAADTTIDLSAIAPYFHVKVIKVPGGVDLSRQLAIPADCEPILHTRSEEHGAVVYVTRSVARCRWSKSDDISDTTHDLYIVYHDEDTELLFICSSRREIGVYDAMVDSVANGEYWRLSPEEVNRVLRNVENASFFSIGMRNRAGFGSAESYRMITGRSADKAVQKADGRFYDRGHCFGKGQSAGKQVTIGFSSSSKVWANKTARLHEFFGWCRQLAVELASDDDVTTKSGLDHLPLSTRITAFPHPLVVADWGETVYRKHGLRLRIEADSETPLEYPLLDFAFRVLESDTEEARFALVGHDLHIEFSFRLDRPRWFEQTTRHIRVECIDAEGRNHEDFTDFIHEHPPAFFTAELSRVDGDFVSNVPESDAPFPAENIEGINWSADGTNPLLEKPGDNGERSLFDWLGDRLLASGAAVIFNDDGSGEAADFISILRTDIGSTVTFYHVKAAGGDPVPGERVGDLYEVAGQAVKSLRLAEKRRLLEHLQRRLKTTKMGAKRLILGTEQDLADLLKTGTIVKYFVAIVQPGVGTNPPEKLSSLLAATNAYVISAQVEPLQVIGTPSL